MKCILSRNFVFANEAEDSLVDQNARFFWHSDGFYIWKIFLTCWQCSRETRRKSLLGVHYISLADQRDLLASFKPHAFITGSRSEALKCLGRHRLSSPTKKGVTTRGSGSNSTAAKPVNIEVIVTHTVYRPVPISTKYNRKSKYIFSHNRWLLHVTWYVIVHAYINVLCNVDVILNHFSVRLFALFLSGRIGSLRSQLLWRPDSWNFVGMYEGKEGRAPRISIWEHFHDNEKLCGVVLDSGFPVLWQSKWHISDTAEPLIFLTDLILIKSNPKTTWWPWGKRRLVERHYITSFWSLWTLEVLF